MITPEMNKIYQGSALEILKTWDAGIVDCGVTSPPYYGLRNYGEKGQIGAERTLKEYIDNLVAVFRQVRRVMKPTGTLFLNLGDSYNAGRDGGHPGGKTGFKNEETGYLNRSGCNIEGLKPKDLIGVPWRVALALQESGWYLRNDIIWVKPNYMPESMTDRLTRQHEYIFFLTKSPKYYFDQDAIRIPHAKSGLQRAKYATNQYTGEDTKTGERGGKIREGAERKKVELNPLGKNRTTVWEVANQVFKTNHFAVYPEKLIEPCIKAGCPEHGVVLDPFFGSGTTGIVAERMSCKWLGIELNSEYIAIANRRLGDEQRLF